MPPTMLELRIRAIDAATLTPILRKALNRSTIKLTQWNAEPIRALKGGLGPSLLYCFTGSAEERDEALAWSLILKVLTEPVGNEKRELEFYRSDLAHALPPGLRPAHCYAISEQIDETGRTEYWLWLEELTTQSGARWTLDDHQRAARHLGQFNGAFLVDRPLPSRPWLDSSGVRGYLEHVAPWVAQLQQHQNHPLVRRMYPPAAVERFLQLWQNRETYLATLARLPQTLCHRDAQRSNLFLQMDAAGNREMVAIDWGTIGIEAIGYDISQLIGFSLGTMEVDLEQATALDRAVFDGYLHGLQDAGWRGDPELVRLGYTTAAIKSSVTSVFRSLSVFLGADQNLLRQFEQAVQDQGFSVEEAADRLSRVDAFFSTLLREARELRDRL